MAAPLQSFLFSHGAEMAGKNIGLIVSSASSGVSGVEADAKRLIPDGNFLTPSLWIRSSQITQIPDILPSPHPLLYAAMLSPISYSLLVFTLTNY